MLERLRARRAARCRSAPRPRSRSGARGSRCARRSTRLWCRRASRGRRSSHLLGHVHAEPGDRDRRAVRARRSARLHREGERAAHGELAVDGRASPCRGRSGRAPSRASHSSVSSSPGRTMRLKRTSSIPAKSASLPRFSSCESTATAPACASASTIFTPGMIGLPGKWPGAVLLGDRLRATTREPGLELEHLVEQQERVAVREDRLDLPSCPNGRRSCRRAPRAARAGGSGRGGRSTWPCRPASRVAPRSPRTRGRARPSGRRPRACAGGSSARQRRAPRAARRRERARGSPSPARAVLVERLRRARARCAAATSRHVFTTSRCSQVENCDSPRNCWMRVQSFASDSCAASRASSGSRRRCRASCSTRGAWRSQGPRAPCRSPSFARLTRIGSLSLS